MRWSLLIRLTLDGELPEVLVVPERVGDNDGGRVGPSRIFGVSLKGKVVCIFSRASFSVSTRPAVVLLAFFGVLPRRRGSDI